MDLSDELHVMSTEELSRAVAFEVQEAVHFSEREFSETRERAQRYFNGATDVKADEGRSKVIVSRTRDTVRQMLPSLMRIFMQSSAIVRFLPRSNGDGAMCRQQTDICNSIFWNNSGYKCLIEAFTNALNKRTGIVKITYERETVAVHTPHDELSRWEIDLLEDEGLEITEETKVYPEELPEPEPEEDEGDPLYNAIVQDNSGPNEDEMEEMEDEESLYDVISTKRVEKEVWKFTVFPPEEFIIDKYATCLNDAQLVGWYGNKRVSDLVDMGFDINDLLDVPYDSSRFENEREARYGYYRNPEESDDVVIDPSGRLIAVSDVYMRIDADGDGYAELRHIITVGIDHKILLDEPVNYIPFAQFVTDIEPHAFFPLSINESTWQDSDAQTALLRAILDNAHMVNNPRTVAHPKRVNIEDLMNPEIGAIIRADDPSLVSELATPNTAQGTLPVLQYLETMSEKRTGLVNSFQGTDPDALQSTSRAGVMAMIQGGQSMVQMVARNLAEGLEQMFRIIIRIIKESKQRFVCIRGTDGKFYEYDVSSWHGETDTEIDVGLGTQKPEEKALVLREIAQKQEQALMQFGPANPYIKYSNLHHTYTELLRTVGYKNVTDFFPVVDPNEELKFAAEMNQRKAQEMSGDAQAQAYLQAEKYKADSKAKVDAMKTQMKTQLDFMKEQAKQGDSGAKMQLEVWRELLKDDLERDRLSAETELKAAEIEGKHMVEVDKAQIQREQSERDYRNGPTS